MAGFVYIMSNPLFDRIKIGKSTKDPTKDRLNELNRETGIPEKYKCEYYAFVGDEHGLEFSIHKQFSHERPNPKREFFEVSIPEAIIAIRKTATKFGGIKYEEIYYISPEEIAEAEQAAAKEKAEEYQAWLNAEADKEFVKSYQERLNRSIDEIRKLNAAENKKKNSGNQTDPDQMSNLDFLKMQLYKLIAILGFIYILAILDKNGYLF